MFISRNRLQSGVRKHTINQEITFGPLTLRFITIIIIAALCILYLTQSTQGASKNYKLQELEQTQAELQKENERLQIESVRLQALKSIDSQNLQKEQNGEKQEMVSSEKEEYMRQQ